MQIDRSSYVGFGFTIKYLSNDLTNIELEYSYEKYFEKINNMRGIIIDYKVGELDSQDKLHYHGILLIRKGFYRKRLCLTGFHVKLEELYDTLGWRRYCDKSLFQDEYLF